MHKYLQPALNAFGSLPSWAALRFRRILCIIRIVGFLAIVGVFGLAVMRDSWRTRGHDLWERPFKNARSLGLTLFEFETEFGKPPSVGTLADVSARGASIPRVSKTSNDFLRQLIAAGLEQDERLFFAPANGCREPDNRVDGSHALEMGECGFSYLVGPSFNSGAPQPILVTPLISGTNRFDPKPLGGWAVVLWTDNSVVRLPIDKHGCVMHLGKHLLDSANPIWDGHPLMIVWPE